MVRGARCILGCHLCLVREEPNQLPARVVVAGTRRPLPGQHTRLQVLTKARRLSLGQRRLRPLGASGRVVQQHRLERGTAHGQTVSVGNRKVRVEQTTEFQVYCTDAASVVESCEEHQSFR